MSNNPYYINHKKKKVLIWSPKCACTTLHHAFIRNICDENEKKDTRIIAAEKNYICNDYNKIPKDYEIYWGVRNPIDRIISCFFNKFIVYEKKKINEKSLEIFSKKFLDSINIHYDDITFTKFILGIKYLMDNEKYIDSHFNTIINFKNYEAIKNHPNIIMFDISEIPDVFKNTLKLNTTSQNRELVNIETSNINAKFLDERFYKKENFRKSFSLIKNIFKLDYEILKKHNIIYND